MKFHRPARVRHNIQVIPMIDILLILLIYFAVSTVFKKPRDVMSISLPTVRELPSGKVSESRSIIAVDAQGNVSLDSLAVPDGLLESYLAAFLKQNPGRKLELEADEKLPLGQLIKVWDALTKAGIPIKDVPARIRLPE
ncbi:MAG: biopolymer transporter ExbD [Verrucomicrobiota bacterium]